MAEEKRLSRTLHLSNGTPGCALYPTVAHCTDATEIAQAVRNYFSEKARIRDVVVKLPGKGKSARDWTPLGVAGVVFHDAISSLTEDVSGLKHG